MSSRGAPIPSTEAAPECQVRAKLLARQRARRHIPNRNTGASREIRAVHAEAREIQVRPRPTVRGGPSCWPASA
eukprot:5345312-Lingulodinium_polyedra.AAC.1